MTAQDLKNSILQLAVQGKLVPQDPSDEPASELLKRIEAEKSVALKAGTIKKDKNLPALAEEEIPHDIPSNWSWMHLGELCQLLDGEKLSNVKYPYLEAKYLRGKISATFLNSGKFVKKDTRLILVDGENSGEVFLATEDGYMGSTFKVLYIPTVVYAPYILYFLLLKKQLFRNRKTGAAIPHLNKELFFTLPIPIPPLAEQERIVAKIEELMPLVEEYGKTEEKIKALNAEFPDKLRKSILQQAVQGKLTERDPSDEPASELLKRIRAEKAKLIEQGVIQKEKTLLTISEDEKMFDIPDTWSFVRLDDLVSIRGGKRMPKGRELITTPTDHIYVRVTDMQNGTIQSNDLHYVPNDVFPSISRYIIEKTDIYIVIVGSTIGKTGLVPDMFDGMNLTENAARLTPILINKKYLYYALSSNLVQVQLFDKTKQVGQPKLAIVRLRSAVIPLPPLAEQKRIVARVEELLAACDGLK